MTHEMRRRDVPAIQHRSTCRSTGKIKYAVRADAKKAMKLAHPGARLGVYKCDDCDHFHYGHRPAGGGSREFARAVTDWRRNRTG